MPELLATKNEAETSKQLENVHNELEVAASKLLERRLALAAEQQRLFEQEEALISEIQQHTLAKNIVSNAVASTSENFPSPASLSMHLSGMQSEKDSIGEGAFTKAIDDTFHSSSFFRNLDPNRDSNPSGQLNFTYPFENIEENFASSHLKSVERIRACARKAEREDDLFEHNMRAINSKR